MTPRFAWLLSHLALRRWRRHPVRMTLTVFSIALGVALFVSSQLTTRAVTDSVQRANSAWQLGVDLIVSRAGAGISECELIALRARPEVKGASGVVQVWTRYVRSEQGEQGESVRLLGLDPRHDRDVRALEGGFGVVDVDPLRLLADASSVLLTRPFVTEHALEVGDRIELDTSLGRRSFTIAGVVEVPRQLERAARNFAFCLLASAQAMFGKEGRVDRVDLALADGVDLQAGREAVLASLRESLRASLSDDASIQTPAEWFQELTAAIGGFRAIYFLNELMALLIAVFFVFNAVSAAAAERTRDAGLWRAFGMTRRSLLALFVGEAAVLGLIGLAAGLVVGLFIARGSAGIVREVISTVHFHVPSIEELRLRGTDVLWAMLLAMGATILAAVLACANLVRKRPLEILDSLHMNLHRHRVLSWMGAIGLVMLFCCVALIAHPPRGSELFLGSVVALALPCGVALLAPAFTLVISSGLRKLLVGRAPPPLWLALDAIRTQPARTSMTVTAFALALGLVIGHGGVTRGMHGSLADWMRDSVPAEIIISGDPELPSNAFSFREEVVDRLAELPQVDEVFRLRFSKALIGGSNVMLVAPDIEIMSRRSTFRFVEGDAATALPRVSAGGAALISENLAWRLDLAIGDEFSIATPRGEQRFGVAGIVYDYHHPNGAVFLDLAFYRALFDDPLIDFAELCLVEDADVAATMDVARELLPDDHVFLGITSKDRLIDKALAFIDDLKKLSFVQLFLAVMIGCTGILATVTLSILSRTRELALVRAVGMDRGSLRRTLVWEVVALALASVVIGALIGNLFYIPTNLVMREFTGFTFGHRWPVTETLWSVAVAGITALVSIVFPLRYLSRLDLTAAMEEDA